MQAIRIRDVLVARRYFNVVRNIGQPSLRYWAIVFTLCCQQDNLECIAETKYFRDSRKFLIKLEICRSAGVLRTVETFYNTKLGHQISKILSINAWIVHFTLFSLPCWISRISSQQFVQQHIVKVFPSLTFVSKTGKKNVKKLTEIFFKLDCLFF